MRIRRATMHDAEAIAAIYAPYVRDTVISFELDPPDAKEMRRRIDRIGTTHPWLVAEADGVVGYAYASQHNPRAAYDWSADIGIYLKDAHHRQGVGRQLYRALFAVLRHQGFSSVYAGITLPNDASTQLHAAMGFEEIGIYRAIGYKFSAWHDVLWMGLKLGGAAAPVAPPLAMDDLDASGLQEILSRVD